MQDYRHTLLGSFINAKLGLVKKESKVEKFARKLVLDKCKEVLQKMEEGGMNLDE